MPGTIMLREDTLLPPAHLTWKAESMREPDVHDLPHDFPRAIARPATRALLHAGINSLAELATHSRADIAALHGMGPKAMGILETHLAELGLGFADDSQKK